MYVDKFMNFILPMEKNKININYNTVTEAPGIGATAQQLSMLYTRYRYAVQFCEGKDVLEVACGSGQGLGYLARKARKVVGGDIDTTNVATARDYYKGRTGIEVLKIDAHQLPFENNSFDVIILYEAIYYFEMPEKFFTEAKRILRDEGVLVMCSANKEWPDFNPSPFSKTYYSATELVELLEKFGFVAEPLAAYPVEKLTTRDCVVSIIKRIAVQFHLVPKTMRGKELLKKIFLGKLSSIPPEINDEMGLYLPPQSISRGTRVFGHKVIYITARVK